MTYHQVGYHHPAWSDREDWKEYEYCRTIQTSLVNNELFLLGRYKEGMETYKLNPENRWEPVAHEIPPWSNEKGWNKLEQYWTIQTTVVNNKLFLLGRHEEGMKIWILKSDAEGKNYSWSKVTITGGTQGTPSEWSDSYEWDKKEYFLTIQTAVVNNKLFVLGRYKEGMETWKLEESDPTTESYSWELVASKSPELSDIKNWNKHQYFSTIQTAVVNNKLFLLARYGVGMKIFLLKSDAEEKNYSWSEVTITGNTQGTPSEWSDDYNWDKSPYYSTIQTAVVNNKLFLLGRYGVGMKIFLLKILKSDAEETSGSWSEVTITDTQGTPSEWSDSYGWDNPRYYSTIQTAVVNNKLFLLGRAEAGMDTYELDFKNHLWFQVGDNNPEWSDSYGWYKNQYRETIQTAVVNNKLFLLGRAEAGMETWLYELPCELKSLFNRAPRLIQAYFK